MDFLKDITIIPMVLHKGDTHSFNETYYIFLSFLLFIL